MIIGFASCPRGAERGDRLIADAASLGTYLNRTARNSDESGPMLAAPLRAALLTVATIFATVLLSKASHAQHAESPPEIAVIQGITQQSLAPLAPGYLEWMRQRLGAAGLRVARGSASRLSPAEVERRPDQTTTAER